MDDVVIVGGGIIGAATAYFLSKEGRKDGVDKIRDEIKKAVKKERYLSKEDAKLINQVRSKIRNELKESEDFLKQENMYFKIRFNFVVNIISMCIQVHISI